MTKAYIATVRKDSQNLGSEQVSSYNSETSSNYQTLLQGRQNLDCFPKLFL